MALPSWSQPRHQGPNLKTEGWDLQDSKTPDFTLLSPNGPNGPNLFYTHIEGLLHTIPDLYDSEKRLGQVGTLGPNAILLRFL
jgi:hypothetical protein